MSSSDWNIKNILEVTSEYLKKKAINNPRLSAELLLAHLLKKSRVALYLSFDQPLNEAEINEYRSLVMRCVAREPIQYITGKQEFWSMEFDVDKRVLIPRPESELLVEQVIALCGKTGSFEEQSPRILDMGTGSGAIAISIAQEIKNARIWASDISNSALDVAIGNAKKHGMIDRIRFLQGDLFQPFRDLSQKFDIIISNPPYIPSEDYPSLQPEVRDYEPRLALDGNEKGMFFIREIITQGQEFLDHAGWLLIEMDPEQTPMAFETIEGTGGYREKKRIKDYSRRYRIVLAKKK
ncbi:MAG: peptide chain release factor N(5)-glutamine methyltransferase [Deltaproteobacteria bacterium]|nr:peptide chain release factor N(5)-glutamine methyltransferase [Deltaproteobacteria bacterium]